MNYNKYLSVLPVLLRPHFNIMTIALIGVTLFAIWIWGYTFPLFLGAKLPQYWGKKKKLSYPKYETKVDPLSQSFNKLQNVPHGKKLSKVRQR